MVIMETVEKDLAALAGLIKMKKQNKTKKPWKPRCGPRKLWTQKRKRIALPQCSDPLARCTVTMAKPLKGCGDSPTTDSGAGSIPKCQRPYPEEEKPQEKVVVLDARKKRLRTLGATDQPGTTSPWYQKILDMLNDGQPGMCTACNALAKRRPSSSWSGGSSMAPSARWRTWNV
ncbi:hypothetical protein QTO34_002850 [Cnephaeus nilssonii]|uniref:Uncharacterized protein n=1 Tax=Cnephaeus nilssonii TaxID=3371016 RepID=A0AA40HTR9_CNENI|nr:hypothetical protein QTO34_002850 [Eptesicus nilssonii]